MKIIMVRHGEIDANVRKIYAGRSADPLNELGRLQSQSVARRLEGMAVSAVYSSPLRRTLETATIIGEHVSCNPIVADAFNELLMGPWQGLSEVEVAKLYPKEMQIWLTQPDKLQIPGRETLLELQERVLAGLGEILSGLPENACVVLVSHVAVIRVLMLWSSGRGLNDYKQVHVPNATPLELVIPGNISLV